MKKFKKDFLKDVLGFNDEEIKLVKECENLFPELLVNNATKIESVKKLYDNIGLNKTQWSRWYKKNILDSEFFKKNEDWFLVDTKSSKEKLKEKRGQIGQDFIISIEFAKHLVMMAKTENSYKFRKYFILMEKAIKGFQDHIDIREPEKQGYNKMKEVIINDYSNKHENVTEMDKKYLMIRESNMINKNLMGFSASEIKEKLGYLDVETREHLKVEQNKAIEYLQSMIAGLVIAGIEFEERSKIIKNICKNKYKHLKMN